MKQHETTIIKHWCGASAQDLTTLRQEAAQTLLKAAQDGTLEAVLSKKPGQVPGESQGNYRGIAGEWWEDAGRMV